MMQPNYLAFAESNARREFGAPRKTTGDTHWSTWEMPHYALCGRPIQPDEFAKVPTCPECRRLLQEMADADIR